LLAITVSIALSPWFSIYENALSDLGHVTRSSVAPIFNFGLSVGGFLMGSYAFSCAIKRDKKVAASIMVMGLTLMLVGVYDEAYNRHWHLHFKVSVLFFLSLMLFLATLAVSRRRISPLVSLVIIILAWTGFYKHAYPGGTCVPELISILATMPFYLEIVLENTTTTSSSAKAKKNENLRLKQAVIPKQSLCYCSL